MISAVLKDFTACWKAYNDKESLTDQEAAGAINRGDCGLTAIAVSHVLEKKYGVKVNIVQNANHCWIHIPGSGEFDTLHPEGYKTPVKEVWDRQGGSKEEHLTFGEACNGWMPCDALGGYLCKAFFERHAVAMPVELQHCIIKAAEYESPDAVPGLVARYERTLAIPLAV